MKTKRKTVSRKADKAIAKFKQAVTPSTLPPWDYDSEDDFHNVGETCYVAIGDDDQAEVAGPNRVNNAKLIAASPILLSACKNVLARFDNSTGDRGRTILIDGHEIAAILIDAIAKAECT